MNQAVLFAHFPKCSYPRLKKLKSFFGSLNSVWQAEIGELTKAGIEPGIATEFIAWREANDSQKIIADLENENVWTITLGDENYPKLLAQIYDPPFVLFGRGKLPPDDFPLIGVVGTRKCTVYGRQVTDSLAMALSKGGVGIVSGLALGIDGAAHEAALKAGGYTLAVLGSGVDKRAVYPAHHHPLSERIIAAGGAIISEYPPGFKPTQYSFPARNRIIAGLSLGTLVTEAPIESGALITAKAALDYNREVFAVPHSIYSTTGTGNNLLIKQGAQCVTDAQDIFDALQLETITAAVATAPTNSDEEEIILKIINTEPATVDDLIKQSGLSSAQITPTLTMLELKGIIKNLGGMRYARI